MFWSNVIEMEEYIFSIMVRNNEAVFLLLVEKLKLPSIPSVVLF